MDKMINIFIENYNAELVDYKCCEEYVNANDTINIALSFPDKNKNYFLMTSEDLNAFTPEEKENIKNEKMAPFENPILIIYTNVKGEKRCKLVNGMLSKVFELLVVADE